MKSLDGFEAMRVVAVAPRWQSVRDLAAAMMTAEGITKPVLCAQFQLDSETLERRLDEVQLMARLFGWDVYRRKPITGDPTVRYQMRHTDIMPEALAKFRLDPN